MKTALLVLTYNEIEGMRAIMPQVKREWVDRIYVVDGGSDDGTVEYALAQGYEVIRQKRKGLRHAYIEAMEQIEGDVVVAFSPDGNSMPEAIPALIAKIREGYDMVIASRYLDNARSEDDGLITGFGNAVFTKMINLLYHGSYTDSLVMYRAFYKSLFYELDLHREDAYRPEKCCFTTVCIMPLLSIRSAKRKKKIAEIPYDEPQRIGGQRKLQIIRWGTAYLLQTIRELYYWRV